MKGKLKVDKLSAVLFSLFIVLAWMGVCTGNLFSTSNSHIVVPTDYPTIQEAINEANEGDTVYVSPGTYDERVVINTSYLTILGSGELCIILGDNDAHTVEISRVRNVTFSGFLINGSNVFPWAGIHVKWSRYVNLTNNIVTNHYRGIYLWDSSFDIIRNNSMFRNRYSLEVWGLTLPHFLHEIYSSNTVNGKPVYYWVNYGNCQVPSDAGYVALINSSGITVENLNFSGNGQGILLAYTDNSIIKNVSFSDNVRGIHMVISDNNTILENEVSNNVESGILLVSSSDNNIIKNNVTSSVTGIHLSFSSLLPSRSSNNLLSDNSVRHNFDGIILSSAEDNRIAYNEIVRNERSGLVLQDSSSNNVILMSTIVDNEYGVQIYSSSDNALHHNNFIDNTVHAVVYGLTSSGNVWDDGYPSGGNNWDDYAGLDLYSGSYQDELGSDGIGDTQYVIDSANIDMYPLIPPNIDFVFLPSDPKVLEIVNFTWTSVGTNDKIVSWKWEISSGFICSCENLWHQFLEEGSYNITLIARDERGVVNMATKALVVKKMICNLTLSFSPEVVLGQTLTISATLEDENGDVIPESTIRFYVIQGDNSEYIGFFATNSTGVAVIEYEVDRSGLFRISAQYNGSQVYDYVNATKSLVVTQPQSLLVKLVLILAASSLIMAAIIAWRKRGKTIIENVSRNKGCFSIFLLWCTLENFRKTIY